MTFISPFAPQKSYPTENLSQLSTLACSCDSFERSASSWSLGAHDINDEKSEAEFAAEYYRSFGQRSTMRASRKQSGLRNTWAWSNLQREYDFDYGEPLGEGTYGKVCKATPRYRMPQGGGSTVALKICNMEHPHDQGIPETVIREITLLRELNGLPNIMGLYHVSCARANEAYLFCELVEVDLLKLIKPARRINGRQLDPPRQMREVEVKKIIRGILRGLSECHAACVIHRDLKPQNILVSRDLKQVKIADFGLARVLHNPKKTLTHEVVTLWYRAPEVLLGDCHYDESIDIWSLGCILVEMMSGEILFRGDSEIDMLFRIFQLLGTPTKDEWPESAFEEQHIFPQLKGDIGKLKITGLALDLIEQMLDLSPARRPSCQECLSHPWLSS